MKREEAKELIEKLLLDVEKGRLGEIDYKWDGKKIVKDNIIFKRQDLIHWFAELTKRTGKGGKGNDD